MSCPWRHVYGLQLSENLLQEQRQRCRSLGVEGVEEPGRDFHTEEITHRLRRPLRGAVLA